MATNVIYKAKWTGKDHTMVRTTQMGDKIRVEPNETVEVEQAIAHRLMREPEWVVEDEPKVVNTDDGEKKVADAPAAPKAPAGKKK